MGDVENKLSYPQYFFCNPLLSWLARLEQSIDRASIHTLYTTLVTAHGTITVPAFAAISLFPIVPVTTSVWVSVWSHLRAIPSRMCQDLSNGGVNPFLMPSSPYVFFVSSKKRRLCSPLFRFSVITHILMLRIMHIITATGIISYQCHIRSPLTLLKYCCCSIYIRKTRPGVLIYSMHQVHTTYYVAPFTITRGEGT